MKTLSMTTVLVVSLLCTGCQTYLDRIYREAAETHNEQIRFRADYIESSNDIQAQLTNMRTTELNHYEMIVVQLTEISNQMEQLEKDMALLRNQLDTLKFERGGLQNNAQNTSSEGDSIYTRALQLYTTSKYEAAAQTFTLFLEKHSGSSRAGDAQYWLGECYYSQDKHEEALAAYLKTASEYPASSNAPTALFRAALIYHEKLNDAAKALETLRQITIAYPNYEQLDRIQDKIKELERR